MAEKNLDFDRIINRKGTKSLKYDFAKEHGIPEDALPLWVGIWILKRPRISRRR